MIRRERIRLCIYYAEIVYENYVLRSQLYTVTRYAKNLALSC